MAWKEFRRGKAKKRDVQEFELNLEDNIFQLHDELAARVYRHSAYTSFFITDPKLRYIHKACVRDRIVHHAIFRVLYPIFDPMFIYDSYSCRLGKGTHRAVKRLNKFVRALSRNNHKPVFVLKCDVKKFFDSVDHETLLKLIQKKIRDLDMIWLIKTIVASFEKTSGTGLPIGNVTSQLFANIYLNELDQYLKHELGVKYYIRYCDDFVILRIDNDKLTHFAQHISEFLGARLKLTLHPNKIVIKKYRQGIDFLGYVVRPRCITLRTCTKKRLLERITQANAPPYLGVLKHCNGFKIMKLAMIKLG